jgi:hypothetical protein
MEWERNMMEIKLYIFSCGASTWFSALAFMFTLIGQTTLGRSPLDEWSGRCRDPYMTQNSKEIKHLCVSEIRTHNPASKRPQTCTLECPATGISISPQGRNPKTVTSSRCKTGGPHYKTTISPLGSRAPKYKAPVGKYKRAGCTSKHTM